MSRIIYYYQTFTSLKPILVDNTVVTHIHLSSIHFGLTADKTPYIHLNDHSPENNIFDNLWKEINQANKLGIKIILMIGGAGGAFSYLFSDFNTYYELLKNTILKYRCISGVDLDVEESVSLENISLLIKKIKSDFGDDFIITMAPISESMETDNPGMGGFVYKDLYNSEVGKYIDYFNVQFYSDFSEEAYLRVINNGYQPDKIVMGLLSNNKSMSDVKKIIKYLYTKYEEYFGGVYVWEYFNAMSDKENPYEWALEMKEMMTNNIYSQICLLS